jgi:hypothetical protein
VEAIETYGTEEGRVIAMTARVRAAISAAWIVGSLGYVCIAPLYLHKYLVSVPGSRTLTSGTARFRNCKGVYHRDCFDLNCAHAMRIKHDRKIIDYKLYY